MNGFEQADCEAYRKAANVFYSGGKHRLAQTEKAEIIASFSRHDFYGGLRLTLNPRFCPASEVIGRMVYGWQKA